MSPRLEHAFHLMMTTDAVGGVWRYSIDLAMALQSYGIAVTLVGLGPRPTDAQREEARNVAELLWLDLPLDWQVPSEDALAEVPRCLKRVVQDYRPDALQLHLPSQADGLDLDIPLVVVAHSCVVTWFRAVMGTQDPPDWQWQRRKNERGLRAADVVVAPSAAFAELLETCYGPVPSAHVIYNATRSAPTPASQRPFAMAAGRWWDKGKNAAALDRAASESLLPVKAAGATTGPNGESVQFSHLETLGPQSHATVAALLATAEIAVSPSLYEPFGLVALEAAKAGSALVLSNIPTYRELWQDCAMFFSPRDPDELALMINTLAEDEPLHRTLAANAQARAEIFTPERQALAMAELYRLEPTRAIQPSRVG